MKTYLFIDPASVSLGFAEFSKTGQLIDHFSIKAKKKDRFFERMAYLKFELNKRFINKKFNVVCIEQMSGRTNVVVKWAVGGLIWFFSDKADYVTQINVSSWKKAFGLNIKEKGAKITRTFRKYYPTLNIKSDDEIEAILMGLAYIKNKSKGKTARATSKWKYLF